MQIKLFGIEHTPFLCVSHTSPPRTGHASALTMVHEAFNLHFYPPDFPNQTIINAQGCTFTVTPTAQAAGVIDGAHGLENLYRIHVVVPDTSCFDFARVFNACCLNEASPLRTHNIQHVNFDRLGPTEMQLEGFCSQPCDFIDVTVARGVQDHPADRTVDNEDELLV